MITNGSCYDDDPHNYNAEVSIEMSISKDQSLSVIVTGKADAVLRARKDLTQSLQQQVRRMLMMTMVMMMMTTTTMMMVCGGGDDDWMLFSPMVKACQ